MPRPISYAVFFLNKIKDTPSDIMSELETRHTYHYLQPLLSCNHPLFFFNDTATTEIYTLSLHDALPIFQGDVLATDNNTVGMGDAGIKSAIQGSNVPNPDEAVPSFVSGAMAKAGKGLLEGTLQAGTSAVSDKLLDLVGLGGKSAADK